MFPGLSSAQKITATLRGDITDVSGAAVIGAKVSVRNQATNAKRETLANDRGSYVIDLLPAGRYDVSVEHPGFSRRTFSGVEVQVDQDVRLDASLQVGEVRQEVSVEAAAPLLQTNSSSVGSVIEERQVQSLPLNGRQFLQLALLIPGVVASPPGSRQSSERGTLSSAININGNREGSNLFLIDGTLNTDPNFNTFVISPNIDSILEFKVETSSYSPEFGQQAGGQINLITRGGTNQFHGTAYEFLRNSALDAKNLFDRPAPAKIPPFVQNQFGATVGGHIKRDKIFFFGSYEGFRQVKAQTSTATVPNADIRQGDFSNRRSAAGQVTPIFDPLTTAANPAFNSAQPESPSNPRYGRSQFPNNMIPASRLDPIAVGILKYVDLPNVSAQALSLGSFLNNASQREPNDQFSIRIDDNLTSRDQLFVRYSYTNESLFAPGALSSQGTRREPRAQIATLGHTHIFGTAVANDARIGFTRLRLNILNKNAFTQNIPKQLGINGEDGLPPSAWDVPMVSFTEGLTSFGGATFGVPSVTRDNTYQFQDTLSYTRGSHNLRMGLQYTRYQLNNATLNYILPQYIYRATPLTADVTNPVGNSRGSEFADFMLGYFHSIQVSSGSGQIYLRRNVIAPWAEDTWRATRNLTLTLGLRWDYFSPYVEQNNQIGSLYVPQPNGPGFPIPVLAGTNIQGYGNVPRGLFPKDLNNLAPRVGLAYRPRGSDKTVFRVGYGIFYDAQIGNTLVDMVRNPPFQVRIIADMPDSIFPSFVLRDPFPQGFGVTSSYFAYGQEKGGRLESPTPYIQQWNATVQRELVPNWAATVAYIGSTGRHLSLSSVDNVPYPGPGPLNSRRPFNPFLTSIFQWAQPRVNSYYNALQIKSEQRGFHGLTLLNSYTWSKSIDTGTEVRAGGTAQQSLNDWNQDEENRGRSTFDVRHRFVSSLLYEIPVGPGKRFLDGRSLPGHLLGGWQSQCDLNRFLRIAVYNLLGYRYGQWRCREPGSSRREPGRRSQTCPANRGSLVRSKRVQHSAGLPQSSRVQHVE